MAGVRRDEQGARKGSPRMIEVEHLTKLYGDYIAIEDVSFRVEEGEIVGFLGPNGAGKTTTMRILTGYMPATDGKARIAGYDVFEDSMEARRRIGYLPERPPLYMDMTVRDYLEYVGVLADVPSFSLETAVDEVVERCGLEDVEDRLIGHLSKGYRQRVGIAQALVHDPEVLILDEPTSALDPRQVTEIRDLIKSLAGKHTILLSTHILPEITKTCQRVIIINEGRIVAEDSLDSLTEKVGGPRRIYVRVHRESAEFPASVEKIEGVTKVIAREGRKAFVVECEGNEEISFEIGRIAYEKGWGLDELREERPSLEEAFLKLVTSDRSEPAAEADEAEEEEASGREGEDRRSE